MPASLTEQEKVEARTRFDALVTELRQEHPHVTIRSVAEEYDWYDATVEKDVVLMGKLRHDVIDLVALDPAELGFSIDHPVIFFDADTKQIAKAGVKNLAGVLTAADARELAYSNCRPTTHCSRGRR